jgi:hypothetical protein
MTLTTTATDLKKFNTLAEMLEAYAQDSLDQDSFAMFRLGIEFNGNIDVYRMVAREKYSYVPFISNAGAFIGGYGYTTERVAHLESFGGKLVLSLDAIACYRKR